MSHVISFLFFGGRRKSKMTKLSVLSSDILETNVQSAAAKEKCQAKRWTFNNTENVNQM